QHHLGTLTAQGFPVVANTGQTFTGPVATFTVHDRDPAPATEYYALIHWSDRSADQGAVDERGVVTADPDHPGTFLVTGTHTWDLVEHGSVYVRVQENDDDATVYGDPTSIDVFG